LGGAGFGEGFPLVRGVGVFVILVIVEEEEEFGDPVVVEGELVKEEGVEGFILEVE